jgi:hypothetical protein
MLGDCVTSADVASVISRSTGIPLQVRAGRPCRRPAFLVRCVLTHACVCRPRTRTQALMSGERDKLLHIEERLGERVVGQPEAVAAVSNAIRLSRAGASLLMRPCALSRSPVTWDRSGACVL